MQLLLNPQELPHYVCTLYDSQTNNAASWRKKRINSTGHIYIPLLIHPTPSCCILCYSKDGCKFLTAKLFSKRFTGRTKRNFFLSWFLFSETGNGLLAGKNNVHVWWSFYVVCNLISWGFLSFFAIFGCSFFFSFLFRIHQFWEKGKDIHVCVHDL